jgi:hypothetical protein
MALWNEFKVDNTLDIEGSDEHCLHFDSDMRDFLGRGMSVVSIANFCRLLSGSY